MIYDINKLKQNIKNNLPNLNISPDDILKLFLDKNALASLLEKIIDIIMLAERDTFIQNNPDEVKNGFSSKILNTKLDKLTLAVPRTRSSNFRPVILPEKYKRTDDSLFEFIKTLIASGCSKNNIINILKQYDISFSEDIYEQISEEIETKLNDFRTKQLPEDMLFVFIDGYVCDIKEIENNKVRSGCIYTVIGIDIEGKKQILGYYIVFGPENKSDWLKIFHDLVNRGLKKILMIICDDFSGITDAIRSIYPKTYIQKCCVHLMRNIRRKLAKEDAKEFIKEFKMIKESKSYDEGRERFDRLCEKLKGRYKNYMEIIKGKAEEYLAFLRFPEEVRKYIVSTNVVENFNCLIEKERIRLGGYFQSNKIAEQIVYLKIEHLHNDVWKKPNPMIVSKKYDLNQMFQLTFEE